VVRSSAIAVSYAVIGAKPGIADRFTNSEGKFVLRDVNPGQLTLSARHIGYAPLDTTFEVSAGDTVRLRLELALVTIQLPAVRSLAQRCAHPGGVNTQLSAELQVLFDQVKQNAERNRLLAASYPFEVVVERKITKPEPALEARFIAYDTVVRSSDRKWRYSPATCSARGKSSRCVRRKMVDDHDARARGLRRSAFSRESLLRFRRRRRRRR
jgi:hypothetical protein